jgi:hypothetical protein
MLKQMKATTSPLLSVRKTNRHTKHENTETNQVKAKHTNKTTHTQHHSSGTQTQSNQLSVSHLSTVDKLQHACSAVSEGLVTKRYYWKKTENNGLAAFDPRFLVRKKKTKRIQF